MDELDIYEKSTYAYDGPIERKTAHLSKLLKGAFVFTGRCKTVPLRVFVPGNDHVEKVTQQRQLRVRKRRQFPLRLQLKSRDV